MENLIYKVKLIEGYVKAMFGIMFGLALVGVGLHILWCYYLSFFNFKAEDSRKKNWKRLLYPCIPVVLIGFFLPFIMVIWADEFRRALQTTDISKFLNKVLLVFLPIDKFRAGLSMFMWAFIGGVLYFLIGLILRWVVYPIYLRIKK